MSQITQREQEVLNLIAYEYSSKEIADRLYVSYETVNSHRKNIMTKMGVKNTAGLIRVAFERNLLPIIPNLSRCLMENTKDLLVRESLNLGHKYSHQIVTCIFIFLTFVTSLEGQREEIDPVIYNYIVNGIKFTYDAPCVGGIVGEEISSNTCIAGFAFDFDGQPTFVDDLDDMCVNWESPGDEGASTRLSTALITEQSSSSLRFLDITTQFYHNSIFTPICSFESLLGVGDCGGGSVGFLVDVLGSPPGQVNVQTLESDGFNGAMDIQTYWRPTFGTINLPISVGELNSTKRYHVNSTAASPVFAEVDLDYNNDWSSSFLGVANDSPDVTYSFSLDNYEKVTITTSLPSTNFPLQMHLLRVNDDGSSSPIITKGRSTSSSGTTIVALLEPGEYRLVVEGSSSDDTGRFEVEFSAEQVGLNFGDIDVPASLFEFEVIPEITSLTDASLILGPIDFNILANTPIDYEWRITRGNSNDSEVVPGVTTAHLPRGTIGKMRGESLVITRFSSISDFITTGIGYTIDLNESRPLIDDCFEAGNLAINPVGITTSGTIFENRGARSSTYGQFSCIDIGEFASGRDVWFKAIVPSSRHFEVEILNAGPCTKVTDWVMAVYRGDCSSSLEEIACNDDQPDGARQPRIALSPGEHSLTPGETIFIRLIDWNSDDAGCAFIVANDLGCTDGSTSRETGLTTAWFSRFSWLGETVPSFCDDVVIGNGDIIVESTTGTSEAVCRTLEVVDGSFEVPVGATLTVDSNE